MYLCRNGVSKKKIWVFVFFFLFFFFFFKLGFTESLDFKDRSQPEWREWRTSDAVIEGWAIDITLTNDDQNGRPTVLVYTTPELVMCIL